MQTPGTNPAWGGTLDGELGSTDATENEVDVNSKSARKTEPARLMKHMEVLFGKGSDVVGSAHVGKLAQFGNMLSMTNHPQVTVNIVGHTSNPGDAKTNQALSEKRAANVEAAIRGGGGSISHTRQPRICVHYNPYTCWYKRVLTPVVSEDFLRIDARRMAYVLEHVAFDDDRRLVGVPDWDAMVKAMAEMEVAPLDGAPVDEDAAFDRWQELAASGASGPEAPAQRSYGELGDPCTGCSAYCCKALVFPGVTPTNVSGFDYLRFALGFPGIEVGVSDRGWSLIVRTTCRHLENDRCTLYGKPERPLLCRYYDAQRCTYKPQFGVARPQDFVRVRLEQWHWLVEAFSFDEHGAITQGASSGEIREHIEAGWRAAVQNIVAAHTGAVATPPADGPGNP